MNKYEHNIFALCGILFSLIEFMFGLCLIEPSDVCFDKNNLDLDFNEKMQVFYEENTSYIWITLFILLICDLFIIYMICCYFIYHSNHVSMNRQWIKYYHKNGEYMDIDYIFHKILFSYTWLHKNIKSIEINHPSFICNKKISHYVYANRLKIKLERSNIGYHIDLNNISLLKNITHLILNDSDIHSIKGLSVFQNLKKIKCFHNHIRSLNEIEKCTQLMELDCSDNDIILLRPLYQLNNLTELIIDSYLILQTNKIIMNNKNIFILVKKTNFFVPIKNIKPKKYIDDWTQHMKNKFT